VLNEISVRDEHTYSFIVRWTLAPVILLSLFGTKKIFGKNLISDKIFQKNKTIPGVIVEIGCGAFNYE
jgi:hypothetical protein